MKTKSAVFSLLALALAAGPVVVMACGGAKSKPKSPDDLAPLAADAGSADAADGGGKSVCTGADLDLANVLVQSACEVPNQASDAKRKDVSQLLDVKVTVSPNVVPPGGHADVVVIYTNKSNDPLPLDFVLDPTPRFSVEVYTKTNKRAEMPQTRPPRGKNDSSPEPTAPGTAEVILPPGGKTSVKLDWSAVRLKWAPELVKGTPPEQGYPTSPAGPLAKGVYLLKVITPLTGVFEGSDREVSTVKTNVTVK